MARPRKNPESGNEMLPVKLAKNYRPIGDFLVCADDGEREPSDIERSKVPAGSTIFLASDEARDVVRKGIGERADEF